jgi:hypothetical protein
MNERHATQVPGPEVIQLYHPLHTLYVGMHNLLTPLRALRERLEQANTSNG